jgi:hypothetical protein
VLRHWGLESVEGLSPDAEEARGRVLRYMARVSKAARRVSERRQDVAQDDDRRSPAMV